MIHTPSPITPTGDQADTIADLGALGALFNVEVDAGPLDEDGGACDNDWAHDHGVVCTPSGDRLCPACAWDWLRWFPGELVSLDVLRVPDVAAARRAA